MALSDIDLGDDELDPAESAVQLPVQLPPTPAPGNVRIVIEGSPADTAMLGSLASLLLGSAAEGGELFVERLKRWQTAIDGEGDTLYSESPNETDEERLRYALIGLLARAPRKASKVFSTALEVTDSFYVLFSGLATPVTNSRFMQPVHRHYKHLTAHGEMMVEGWIDEGRTAEQRSRALARRAAFQETDEGIELVVGRLADEPAVRDLVTQQGIGMASEVMGAVRERGAVADTAWERRVRTLLRRK